MAQILQGVPNNYETDLLFPILQKAAELAGLDYHTSSVKQKSDLKAGPSVINASLKTSSL